MKNNFHIEGDEVLIEIIYKGSFLGYTRISTTDLDLVNSYGGTWRAKKDDSGYYVYMQYNNEKTWLHTLICPSEKGMHTDHKDGDTLNNKRSNLRSVPPSHNQHNQSLATNTASGMKGVQWHKQSQKWRVRVTANGVTHEVGRYKSLAKAKQECIKAKKRLQEGFLSRI